jgi:hypothetical protein
MKVLDGDDLSGRSIRLRESGIRQGNDQQSGNDPKGETPHDGKWCSLLFPGHLIFGPLMITPFLVFSAVQRNLFIM